MRELYIRNLCIETTRRCNMHCTHYMRGDAESVNIPLKHISNLLWHVKHIYHFNITGGESPLSVRTICHIPERVYAYGITVNDLHIATNDFTTSCSEELIEACVTLYGYQEEREQDSGHMSGMSDDRFHDMAGHTAMLVALSPYPLFGVRRQAGRISLFREDHSTEGFPNSTHRICLTEENYIYGDLCLNAEGMVLSSGDLSHAHQREHAPYSCGKLTQYLRMALRKRQKERLYK